MKQLNSNWFVEGLQDFEYKKYLLLAYLKWTEDRFREPALYPALADLIGHFNNLHQFRKHITELKEQFPQRLSGVDLENLRLEYEGLFQDDESMREVEEVVNYSLPRIQAQVEAGKEIYEFIDECIEIEEVGLLPLYRDTGYFLIRDGNRNTVKAYEYQVTIFERANEKYRGIQTRCVGEFSYGLANTLAAIKLSLIRANRTLPNPATFSIYSRMSFPETATLVPVAKRKFIRHLAKISA